MKQLRGRPEKETEKRDQTIRVRVTKSEKLSLTEKADGLGILMSDLVRSTIFNGKKHFVNGVALIASLDTLGSELGRSGNNINQLAKHANILNKTSKLDESVITRFNVLFAEYIKAQESIEVVIRKIIRESKV
ncbi:plasmid mobilization relaxosome protein MobC [bacterium]|nr:MAG: plasmid mobilization relaxosome protein MobC [bacterium]